jgi:hypothetical protein
MYALVGEESLDIIKMHGTTIRIVIIHIQDNIYKEPT